MGISNFSSVWEDMCSTYAFATFNDIAYADTNIVFNGQRVANSKSAGYFPIFKKINFIDPFYIEFRGEKRWMRPDLVRITGGLNEINYSEVVQILVSKEYAYTLDFTVSPISIGKLPEFNSFCSNLKMAVKNKHINGTRIIGKDTFKNFPKHELIVQKNIPAYKTFKQKTRLLDWKYMDQDCFSSCNKKVAMDITKQLCYEFSLQKSKPDTSIESQFVIPWFYAVSNELEERIGDFMDNEILHLRLRDNKLQVFKANFLEIQAVYLSHD